MGPLLAVPNEHAGVFVLQRLTTFSSRLGTAALLPKCSGSCKRCVHACTLAAGGLGTRGGRGAARGRHRPCAAAGEQPPLAQASKQASTRWTVLHTVYGVVQSYAIIGYAMCSREHHGGAGENPRSPTCKT